MIVKRWRKWGGLVWRWGGVARGGVRPGRFCVGGGAAGSKKNVAQHDCRLGWNLAPGTCSECGTWHRCQRFRRLWNGQPKVVAPVLREGSGMVDKSYLEEPRSRAHGDLESGQDTIHTRFTADSRLIHSRSPKIRAGFAQDSRRIRMDSRAIRGDSRPYSMCEWVS